MTLTELADKHGTDKGYSGPSDQWTGHGYTDVYESYLWPLRWAQGVKLLEIGLGIGDANIVHGSNQGAASMRMWAEYFRDGRIYGLDIQKCLVPLPENCTTAVADQSDAESLLAAVEPWGKFDVIVDDGSHVPLHQQITFEVLWPKLRVGGMYFIEDCLHRSSAVAPNTRDAFRQIQRTGKPAGLISAESIESIEQINFHCCQIESNRKGKYRFRFIPGTEKLVAIVKG